MLKVLIICDLFPPQFAPRMGYLCKYMTDFGWQPFVLSAEFNKGKIDKDFSFLAHNIEVERIFLTDIEQQKYLEDQKYSLKRKIKAFFLPDYNRPPGVNEKMFYRGREILLNEKFDIILCSTHQVTPLGAANKLSEQFNIPWIADLRDIQEQNGKYKLPFRDLIVVRRNRIRRDYLLRKAVAVISVSPWHVDYLRRINSNVHLIYNGFDPTLFTFEPPRKTSKFTICYIGAVINSDRDVTFLFSAISRLVANNIIDLNKFELNFYADTMTHEYVLTRAKNYRIEFLVNCKPYVPATEIPETLHNSSILLLLAQKSTKNGPKGIMTTKFFEYLGVGRPILLTRSDESLLEQVLIETRSGIAARTVDDVYNFICDKYLEWQKYNFTTGTTDPKIIIKYSRREQARQFVDIFESIIG